MIQWQSLACIVLIIIFVREIVIGLQKLYVSMYTTSYTLGKSTQEAEDTKQLLTTIAKIKKEYPEAESGLIALWNELTGQTTESKKVEEEKTIGFK